MTGNMKEIAEPYVKKLLAAFLKGRGPLGRLNCFKKRIYLRTSPAVIDNSRVSPVGGPEVGSPTDGGAQGTEEGKEEPGGGIRHRGGGSGGGGGGGDRGRSRGGDKRSARERWEQDGTVRGGGMLRGGTPAGPDGVGADGIDDGGGGGGGQSANASPGIGAGHGMREYSTAEVRASGYT